MSTNPISPRRSRNFAWLWLAYTGFIFIDPVLSPPSLYLWLATFAVLFIFIAIFRTYFRAVDCNQKIITYWMIAATFALALFTFPWNGGATTFFVYTAAFLPFSIKSVRTVFLLFLAEALIILAEGYYFHGKHGFWHVSWPNTFVAVFITLIVGTGNVFFAEQKRSDRLLQAAQEENHALAAVAERERIARDLHDVLGHTLSVIVLKAELASRLLAQNPSQPPDPTTARAAAEVADIERITRTALSEVREAITGYRAQGLAAEIEAARRTLDAAGVTLILAEAPGAPFSTQEPGAPFIALKSGGPFIARPLRDEWDANTPASATTPALSAQEETVLALALREAVTNIVRHARATTCTLHFVTPSDTTLRRLIIEDDGHAPTPPREGNGLRGMRARIESIGGKLTLETTPGTRLLITLPQSALS